MHRRRCRRGRRVKTIGRPRSTQADRAIVDAVLEEVVAAGIDGMSIEQIASRAGVAKATVYRRWPNKEALLLDAIAARAGRPADTRRRLGA